MSIQNLIHIGFFVFDCNRSYIWYDIHIFVFTIHFVGILNLLILLTNCYNRAIITMIFSIVVIVISIVSIYKHFSSSPPHLSYRAPRHHHYRHHISEILDLFRCALRTHGCAAVPFQNEFPLYFE